MLAPWNRRVYWYSCCWQLLRESQTGNIRSRWRTKDVLDLRIDICAQPTRSRNVSNIREKQDWSLSRIYGMERGVTEVQWCTPDRNRTSLDILCPRVESSRAKTCSIEIFIPPPDVHTSAISLNLNELNLPWHKWALLRGKKGRFVCMVRKDTANEGFPANFSLLQLGHDRNACEKTRKWALPEKGYDPSRWCMKHIFKASKRVEVDPDRHWWIDLSCTQRFQDGCYDISPASRYIYPIHFRNRWKSDSRDKWSDSWNENAIRIRGRSMVSEHYPWLLLDKKWNAKLHQQQRCFELLSARSKCKPGIDVQPIEEAERFSLSDEENKQTWWAGTRRGMRNAYAHSSLFFSLALPLLLSWFFQLEFGYEANAAYQDWNFEEIEPRNSCDEIRGCEWNHLIKRFRSQGFRPLLHDRRKRCYHGRDPRREIPTLSNEDLL